MTISATLAWRWIRPSPVARRPHTLDRWAQCSARISGDSIAAAAGAADESSDVRAAIHGDGEAFARLVRLHQASLSAQLQHYARRRFDLEELVHDVFVEAYLHLGSFRGEAPLLHWLRKIATRVGYRYWNRLASRRGEQSLRAGEHDLADPAPAPGSPQEAAQEIHLLLGRLPPRDRLVLTLQYLEECSTAEIADRLGWTQTRVKVQAFRARRKLKSLFTARQ